jgi:predicted negative regulator of RcsB-dependent stress response
VKSIWTKNSFEEFSSAALRNFLYLSLATSLVSCSWISNKRSLFGDDEEVSAAEAESTKLQTVPKAQYDQLQSKYNALVEQMRKNPPAAASAGAGAMAASSMDRPPEDLVEELNKAKSNNELVETVDVFGKDGAINSSPKGIDKRAPVIAANVTPREIEDQIIKLERAQALLSQNRFDQSLTILKDLESSNVRQIRVRAKFLIGEMLFTQGEYDLSMQVFEEIIHKDAFSGLVLKTLGRLIVCSEKLKLTKKQQKYYSILHDFFESA